MRKEELIAALSKLPEGTEIFVIMERSWPASMFLQAEAGNPEIRAFDVGAGSGKSVPRAFLRISNGPDAVRVVIPYGSKQVAI